MVHAPLDLLRAQVVWLEGIQQRQGMKTIQLRIEVFEDGKGKTIVYALREVPKEFSDEQAAKWIYETAEELLPKVKQKHNPPHRD